MQNNNECKKQIHFYRFSIEGFHVTSYQANFASHHTPDCHVGFLFHSVVLETLQNIPEPRAANSTRIDSHDDSRNIHIWESTSLIESCSNYNGCHPVWFTQTVTKFSLQNLSHNIKLQPSDKILAHTLGWNLKSCYEVNPKQNGVIFFVLFSPQPHCMQKKPRRRIKSCAHKVGTTLCKPSIWAKLTKQNKIFHTINCLLLLDANKKLEDTITINSHKLSRHGTRYIHFFAELLKFRVY